MKEIFAYGRQIVAELHPVKLKTRPEFGHSLWTVSGQVLVSLATFILVYALANWVSEETVGSFRFILALYSSATVFALVGMSTALSRAVAAGKTGSIYEAVRVKVKYSIFASIFFLGWAIYFYAFTDQQYLWLPLLLAGLALPISETLSLYGPYLTGASRFKQSSLYLAVERAVTSFITAVAAYFVPSLLPIVMVYLLSHLVVRYALYMRSLRIVVPNTELDSEMVPYGKHLTVMSLLGVVTSQLDKYILFIFFGPSALAAFWVASIIPQEAGRFLGAVMGTFFPRMVQTDGVGTIRFVRKLFALMTVGTLVLTVTYAFLAKYVFDLLFPLYTEFAIMSVALMFAFAFTPHQLAWSIFTAKQKVKELYIYSFAEPTLTVLVYLAFVPFFGVWGLVYAMCAKTIIMNFAGMYVLLRYRVE